MCKTVLRSPAGASRRNIQRNSYHFKKRYGFVPEFRVWQFILGDVKRLVKLA
jgi:hypothetical protein